MALPQWDASARLPLSRKHHHLTDTMSLPPPKCGFSDNVNNNPSYFTAVWLPDDFTLQI